MLEDVLALIPARGGSKRLPRKNVLPLAGRPLIAHSIAAALAVTPPIRKVLVSTDDQEIAEAARAAGADVPFLRPPELATDAAGSIEVVQHAVAWVEHHEGWTPQWVLLLQPTSPLRTARDIEAAIGMVARDGGDSVIGVTRIGHAHPSKAQRILDGFLQPFLSAPEYSTAPEEPAYRINGALYLTCADQIRQGRFIGARCRPYVMPKESAMDIDTAVDFRLAELLLADRG